MQKTDAKTHGGLAGLVLGAIGVVFGDIGTSPLYAMKTVFAIDGGIVRPTPEDVYGVVSLIFWSIVIIVGIKYVVFILRADNDGEGGILSLAHLARRYVRPGGKRYVVVMALGVLGASLFYGDSLITPAISVMSAVEGLEVVDPQLTELVLPIGLAVLTVLFAVQRYGTERVGIVFGPIMVVWFVTLAAMGLPHIIDNPQVLFGLSPTYGIAFIMKDPFIAFIAMGAVVLSVTGAEALYADMGHFGRRPIRLAWFGLVFISLTINYLGQAELILDNPKEIANPFFHLAPDTMQIPLVVLATCATVIASQAVISGAYSVSRQAERLGYLPRLSIKQTSRHTGGQIYIPSVNWALYGGVVILLVAFRSSERLATAYGIAVTGTLLLTTALFCVYARAALKWSTWRVALMALSFGSLELLFFSANVTKFVHGGWLPVLIAVLVATAMFTWQRGRDLVTQRREKVEGSLSDFLDQVQASELAQVKGCAVFLHPSKSTVPLAFRENVRVNRVQHREIVIVSTVSMNVPHVPESDRVLIDDLGDPHDHIEHVTLRFGFQDTQDIPRALLIARHKGIAVDPDKAFYFVSKITLQRSDRPGMSPWRKRLFITMAHNAADPTEYFKLPIERTVIMGAQIRF